MPASTKILLQMQNQEYKCYEFLGQKIKEVD